MTVYSKFIFQKKLFKDPINTSKVLLTTFRSVLTFIFLNFVKKENTSFE